MFTGIEVMIIVIVTFMGTAFTCLFISGSSVRKHESEAYEKGYKKGYADGRKVGASNE